MLQIIFIHDFLKQVFYQDLTHDPDRVISQSFASVGAFRGLGRFSESSGIQEPGTENALSALVFSLDASALCTDPFAEQKVTIS